jgi:competence protein CoiA
VSFVALRKGTGQRIDLTQIEHPKSKISNGDCLCQLCEAPLMLKGGIHVRDHFAHYPSSPCTSAYRYHEETAAHHAAKLFLLQRLRDEFPEYKTASIECEVPIPEIQRIADILVTFPTDWRQAHEIQLSPITTQELEERTNDYARAGIDVVWWLGKSADTETNRAWCVEIFGCAFSLNISG